MFAVILLSSCNQMLYTTIDVLRPARVYFPVYINSVVVINNAAAQPDKIGHTTENFYKPVEKNTVNTDSLPLFATSSFYKTIENKEFFNNVVLIGQSKRDHSNYTIPKPIFKAEIDSIMKSNDAQAGISLNRITVQDVQAELYDENDGSFISYLEAKYELHWSVYDIHSQNSTSLITRDTLYWESQSNNEKKAIAGLPNRYNALIDGAIMAGEKAVDQFIPHWEKADRYFFTSNKSEFKKGIDAVYHMEWAQAIELWNKMLETESNPYVKAKLAFNLAIVYEISGDIEKAYEMAIVSVNKFNELPVIDYNSYLRVTDYLEDINVRKKELKKINLQLGK